MALPPQSSVAARRRMVEEQIWKRGIRDRRVMRAFIRVPRELFVPEWTLAEAYSDRAWPIACEQTISQPYMVALMTAALELTGTERVLDIGTGSGYQAAILAHLAREVVSIERHEELSAAAAERFQHLGLRNIQCVVGDGTQGWAEGAPYDGILVAAAAAQAPPALLAQLAEHGRLVLPIGPAGEQVLQRWQKHGSAWEETNLTNCRFVPLIAGSPP